MNGQDFLRVVTEAFTPFLKELGFSPDVPSISGRLYSQGFSGQKHSVSVSFEPGDKKLLVLIFEQNGGQLSDIDAVSKTPRLSHLNHLYMKMVSKEERVANETAFRAVVVRDEEETLLLKSAKELRLVLPKHLANKDR